MLSLDNISSSDKAFGLKEHHNRQRLENEISHLGAQGSGSPRPGQGGQVEWEEELIVWLMKSNWKTQSQTHIQGSNIGGQGSSGGRGGSGGFLGGLVGGSRWNKE